MTQIEGMTLIWKKEQVDKGKRKKGKRKKGGGSFCKPVNQKIRKPGLGALVYGFTGFLVYSFIRQLVTFNKPDNPQRRCCRFSSVSACSRSWYLLR